jgi:hypothetical protein
MFAPGELLKRYLGEAFNLAGVPDVDNVHPTFRHCKRMMGFPDRIDRNTPTLLAKATRK